jgi:hypothetical protein
MTASSKPIVAASVGEISKDRSGSSEVDIDWLCESGSVTNSLEENNAITGVLCEHGRVTWLLLLTVG